MYSFFLRRYWRRILEAMLGKDMRRGFPAALAVLPRRRSPREVQCGFVSCEGTGLRYEGTIRAGDMGMWHEFAMWGAVWGCNVRSGVRGGRPNFIPSYPISHILTPFLPNPTNTSTQLPDPILILLTSTECREPIQIPTNPPRPKPTNPKPTQPKKTPKTPIQIP